MFKNDKRVSNLASTNKASNETHLARCLINTFTVCTNGDYFSHYFLSFPPCLRNLRVGLNSPSLWPTIFSVIRTGTCILPLWTAIVRPTISGLIVLARAQVLITVRSFGPSAATLRASLKSTNGPFLSDRLISY